MDGDFFGGGGVVVPANCQSDKHDHLPGDSNYACQQALTRLMASIRKHYPQTCIHGIPAVDGLGRLVAAERGCMLHDQ